MHGNGDKKYIGWVPSDRFEKYNGPNKEIREQYRREMWERESSKPNTQLGGSSATGASGSKGKS